MTAKNGNKHLNFRTGVSLLSNIFRKQRRKAKKPDTVQKSGWRAPAWLKLKETLPWVHDDTRVIVCFQDADHEWDTGIECVTYISIADGDYDECPNAVWMPVDGLPWGDGHGE